VSRQRILVVGAGHVGLYAALRLSKKLRASEAEVLVVDPQPHMTYQPFLPEAAAGNISPRHSVVPLRRELRRCVVLAGEVTRLEHARKVATVQPIIGPAREVPYDHVVVVPGSVSRSLPIPGLRENAVGFKTIGEAIYLRNKVLERLDVAATTTDPATRDRALTFVFVGGGYAGVEAMAELEDLVRDASRHYPTLRNVPRRWILADAADHILNDLRGRLGEYAAEQLEQRGFDLRLSTVVSAVDETGVELSDGERVPTATLVWTAGVRPNPLVAGLGLPLDERGRIVVDGYLKAKDRVWALGDSAAVPNAAYGGAPDPPTCQHALRQARALARNIAAVSRGRQPRTYHYRMLGQAATLGRHKGVFEALGTFRFRGFPGWWLTRTYHLYQLPLLSRRTRVVGDWTVGLFFRRDVVELGSLGRPEPLEPPARS
jgi:NADH:ubiquinone reductase (H+-translocating)